MLTIVRTLTARLSAALIGDDVWGESSTQARLAGGPADSVTVTRPGASPLATVETTIRRGSFVVIDTAVSGWEYSSVHDTREAAQAAADLVDGLEVVTFGEWVRESRDSEALHV